MQELIRYLERLDVVRLNTSQHAGKLLLYSMQREPLLTLFLDVGTVHSRTRGIRNPIRVWEEH